MMLRLDVSQLLWKTRGYQWDYEFICVPAHPALVGWTKFLDEILGEADPRTGQMFFGVLEVEQPDGVTPYPFAAIKFLDPQRKDWTERPVQHFGVWFVPLAPGEMVPESIAEDWHLTTLRALDQTFGREDVFGMPQDVVRNWRRDHPEGTRADHILGVVRKTQPVVIEGPPNPSIWKELPPVKKKPARRLEQTAPRPREKSLTLLYVILGIVLLLALFRLSCGRS